METANSIWLIGSIALAAGVLIGVLAYRLLAPSVRQADQVKSDLDATRDELLRYRDDVNEHFDKTAELVNDLTQNYVKVYQHLATGAQNLGDGKRFDNLLEQQPGKVAIAVDDDTVTAAASAGAAMVGAGASPNAAASTEDVAAASVDGGASGPEASDSLAEARGATAVDGNAAAGAASDAVESGDGERAGATRRPAEPLEPVFNVEALGEAIEKTERESDDATGALPDSKPDTEVRATTH